MDNRHLRAIILKLEDRLSDDDRKRLHFFLGNDVPRRIRDDPSLGGTLSLMESLFDQDKINENDVTFLINAFDEIQCLDAVKLLRDHMRRIQQSDRLNQSIQSLASIMPPTIDQSIKNEEEDKYSIQHPLIIQETISNNNIEMVDITNTNVHPMIEIIDNQSSNSNRQNFSNNLSRVQKVFILVVLLSLIIGLGVLISVFIIRYQQSINNRKFGHLNTLQSIANQTAQSLEDQLQQSFTEKSKQNETIRQLHYTRSIDKEIIRQLTIQLQQSQNEQRKQNKTIQQLHYSCSIDNQTIRLLTNQLQQSRKEQRKQNETIQQLYSLQLVDIEKIDKLTIELNQTLEKLAVGNRNNVIVGYKNQTINCKSTQKSNIPNINMKSKWMQNGVTVAGGHGYRNRLNQLSHSEGVFIDDDQSIYVADTDNDRVVEWRSCATYGEVVAGGNDKGDRNNQLNVPRNVIIDEQSNSLIISDYGNRRIVRWPRRNGKSGETIISNIDGWGLAMDKDGYLYVCDRKKDEVRRWKIGDLNGIIVAGGSGGGNGLHQLNSPHNIFVDQDQSVYVSDRDNHRVVKWLNGAKEGIIVAGGHGQGQSLTQLSKPRGVIVDQSGTVYITDWQNDRIMRWVKGATQGSIVVGGNGNGDQSDQLNGPTDVSFDRQNNLYVLDSDNHRVQKFFIELNSN